MEIEKLDERMCSNFLKFRSIKYEKIVRNKHFSGFFNNDFDTTNYIITIGNKKLHLEFSDVRKDAYSFTNVIGSILFFQEYDLGDNLPRKKIIKSIILYRNDKKEGKINVLSILKKELLKHTL